MVDGMNVQKFTNPKHSICGWKNMFNKVIFYLIIDLLCKTISFICTCNFDNMTMFVNCNSTNPCYTLYMYIFQAHTTEKTKEQKKINVEKKK